MIVNKIPNTLESISATYFPKVDDRTQFQKDVEYNMKMASGLSPAVSNEELTEQTNLQYEEDFYAGEEKALIDVSDPETRLAIAEHAQTFGAINRNDDNISLTDYYTNSEIAKNLQSDDVVRINIINSEEDIPQYMTKYNYLQMKLTEAYNNIEPDYVRLGARIGVPIVANIGSAVLAAAGSSGVGAVPATLGIAALQTIGGGYDVAQLGDTVYNTERAWNQRMSDLISDPNVTNEEWTKHVDSFINDLNTIPNEYQYEIYKSLLEGPDPFADAGGPFSALGLKTLGQPLKGLFGMNTKVLPKVLPNRVKVNEINKGLAEKIMDFKANTVKSESADETVEDLIEQNEKGLSNKDIEFNSFFSDTPREPITVTSQRVNSDIQVVGRNKSLSSDERGEIKFEEPEQTINIFHGRGANNEPMTYEEAVDMMNTKTSTSPKNWRNLAWSTVDSIEYNPEYENDFISVSSASRAPFEGGQIMYKEHHGSGEGGEWYLAGTYASLEADPGSAAKHYYYPMFKEKVSDYRDRMVKETLKYAVENKLLPELKKDNILYKEARLKAATAKSNFGMEDITEDVYNSMLLAIKTPFEVASKNNLSFDNILQDLGNYKIIDLFGGDYQGVYDRFLWKDDTEKFLSPETFIKRSEDAFESFLKHYENVKKMAEKRGVKHLSIKIETVAEDWEKDTFDEFNNEILSMGEELLSSMMNSYTGNAMMIFNKLDNKRRAGYLNSLGVKNPLKNPEGHLIYNPRIGIRPFVDVLEGDKKELAKLKEQEYNRFMSIKDDILKAFPQGDPDILGSHLDKYFKPGMDLYRFRTEISKMYPDWHPLKKIDFYSDKAYNEWEKDYLTSKGYIANWHNGGGSRSTNVVIIDDSKATSVIKQETGLETGQYEVKLGESGHTPVRDGNGRGWYLLERHQMKDDMPILIRNGKIVEE